MSVLLVPKRHQTSWRNFGCNAQLRSKLQVQREKREIGKKLQQVKTLGEASDDEDDSAIAWVKKSRAKAKKEAQQKVRLRRLRCLPATHVLDALTAALALRVGGRARCDGCCLGRRRRYRGTPCKPEALCHGASMVPDAQPHFRCSRAPPTVLRISEACACATM